MTPRGSLGMGRPTVDVPWWGVVRPPFLLLTLSCMALAVGWSAWLAQAEGLVWPHWAAVACVVGALLAHVGVNVLNEVHDVRSGLDQHTWRTPFSGGSGALLSHPDKIGAAARLGWMCVVLTAVIGLGLWWWRPEARWPLMALGAAGLLLVVAYTPWITRHPWWCLMAFGLGFGPLMLLGTEVVLTGRMTWQGAALSLVPLALVNNLLLLNQFPDVDADRRVGRRTVPMVLGRARSVIVMGVQQVAAWVCLGVGAWQGWWPQGVALAVLALPLSLWVLQKAWQARDDLSALQPAMALNVAQSILVPGLLAVGLWLHG
jgi:1,4-dihydroxy-2-naphthoate polyprenyltransferase